MKETQVECINCGMRCQIDVIHDEDTVYDWLGNNCSRGEAYAIQRVGLSYRILKTYLRVTGGKFAAVKVRSLDRVAESEIDGLMRILADTPVPAPIARHDVLTVAGVRFEALENVAQQ